ncbi:hypothetical protein ACXNSR_00225 [Streptomyces sp. NC-S4]
MLHDAVRQTSRIGAAFTTIDKSRLNTDRSKALTSGCWHYFPSDDAPPAPRETSFDLFRLLDQGMD